jgi:hypothetical protein
MVFGVYPWLIIWRSTQKEPSGLLRRAKFREGEETSDATSTKTKKVDASICCSGMSIRFQGVEMNRIACI